MNSILVIQNDKGIIYEGTHNSGNKTYMAHRNVDNEIKSFHDKKKAIRFINKQNK